MAAEPGSNSCVRSYTEVWETTVVFDVGATGAHTLKYGRGISGISRSAAGQFTVNFTDVGGALLDLNVRYKTAAATEPPITNEVVDSFNSSTKTAQFEVWEIDETALRVDPPSGSDCVVTVRWLKTL